MRISGRDPVSGLAKPLTVGLDGNGNGAIRTQITGNAAFNYSVIPNGYMVRCSKGGVWYATNSSKNALHKSTDEGETWGSAIFSTASTIEAVHKTSTGALLVFLNDLTVQRSVNDADFTEVLTSVYPPWPTAGVDSDGDVVLFGEYGSPATGTQMKVHRSTDGGATWSTIITETRNTAGFSHFHTCQRLSLGHWLATTGDQLIRWYYSSNNGATFTLLFSTDRNQIFRTVGVVEVSRNPRTHRLAWSTDGQTGSEGIYYIDLELLPYIARNYTPEVMTVLPHVSVGMAGNRNILIATTIPTETFTADKNAYVYVSRNGGATWQIDATFQVDPSEESGGLRTISSPDEKGVYFLKMLKKDGDAYAETCIKMTPNFNVISSESGISVENRRLTEEIIPRAIYVAHKHVVVSPPKWATKAIFHCRTYTLTGTTPSVAFWTRWNLLLSDKPGPALKSSALAANSTAIQMWYPGAIMDDATQEIGDMKIASLPPLDSMQVSLIIGGTFAGVEGIDAEVYVTWMP